jgi:hypothetical protein
MTLLANIDSIDVFMNDTLRIEYAVRNDSTTSRVNAIQITVRENQTFCATSYKRTLSSIICSERINSSREFEDLHFLDSNIETLRKAVRIFEGSIPNGRPSYNGILGNISHVVEVRVCTSMARSTNPEVGNFLKYFSTGPEVLIPIILLRNRAGFIDKQK